MGSLWLHPAPCRRSHFPLRRIALQEVHGTGQADRSYHLDMCRRRRASCLAWRQPAPRPRRYSACSSAPPCMVSPPPSVRPASASVSLDACRLSARVSAAAFSGAGCLQWRPVAAFSGAPRDVQPAGPSPATAPDLVRHSGIPARSRACGSLRWRRLPPVAPPGCLQWRPCASCLPGTTSPPPVSIPLTSPAIVVRTFHGTPAARPLRKSLERPLSLRPTQRSADGP